jgi:lipopolysaccharide transport system ATP-binding protein
MKRAISIENLSKCFRVSHQTHRQRYRTLRESLTELASAPLSRLRGMANGGATAEDFWALKDVSFGVKPGEVVGIIGRNGAGKSTLLKILSRITKPSEGHVAINGRVGSLLEVGTGFHPELSGRENIYLNGSILGMKHEEIRGRFDEIVEFSGVERFLDTPVKRYSSGMYVRLAFAVAAHLEPEILIIDEVLAVGDMQFQQKCLGKIGEVAKSGRTVLFVSHNLGAVSRLCHTGIYLADGRIKFAGGINAAVNAYMTETAARASAANLSHHRNRSGSGPIRFASASICNEAGGLQDAASTGSTVVFRLDFTSPACVRQAAFSLDIKTVTGTPVLHLVSLDEGFSLDAGEGIHSVSVTVPNLALYPGSYLVSLWAGTPTGQSFDYVQDCLTLQVTPPSFIPRSGLSWDKAVYHQSASWESARPEAR